MTGRRIYTTGEAAQFLGRRAATLRSWRLRKMGPRYSQPAGPGTTVLYSEADLEEYRQKMKGPVECPST